MRLLIAASLAALSLAALPVRAQDTPEIVVTGTKTQNGAQTATRSETVKYADLDLSKPAGVKTLYARIEGAARTVCAPKPSPSDMAGTKDYNTCLSHAVDTAVAQVGNPDLTAMVASAH